MARLTLFAFALVAWPALAQDNLPPLACEGDTPDWQLGLYGETAQFTYNGKALDMTVPQITHAESADFPKALTLLAARDTAILILNKRRCDSNFVTAFPFEVNILTQKGETPVILTGCCTVAE
ncbi:hypothetical protein [uncultured Litoreibacter sp.]|uniref:hypothetical protein n=1 Tax=uncultured Litoreibacter sp. TaxID=1392394 RepID=UPI002623BA5C|nr:hypothetical protein [uncultured Litoreibacter sp.]